MSLMTVISATVSDHPVLVVYSLICQFPVRQSDTVIFLEALSENSWYFTVTIPGHVSLGFKSKTECSVTECSYSSFIGG